MRGEYREVCSSNSARAELPPRARRIRLLDLEFGRLVGTTSACAENTGAGVTYAALHRNYLRVRGEYEAYSMNTILYLELPPRARRILAVRWFRLESEGTTSACAENTSSGHMVIL